MKGKSLLYIILGAIVVLLVSIGIYINFISKDDVVSSYLVLLSLIIGIIGAVSFLVLGMKYLSNKKDYQIMFVSFLILLFTLGLGILNVIYGYHRVVNLNDYVGYMNYVSTYNNLYIYTFFTSIIGVINLNLFIKYKVSIKSE